MIIKKLGMKIQKKIYQSTISRFNKKDINLCNIFFLGSYLFLFAFHVVHLYVHFHLPHPQAVYAVTALHNNVFQSSLLLPP